MNGDFTRLTFRKDKHYKDVRRQQGRVDLDADWNEQADIWAHRTETEARDVIGRCGAPKHHPGFAITGGSGGDFTIGKGRYYVHGILCENETPVVFTAQPDFPGTIPLQAGRYVAYLDVWQRHITALDDSEIREVALGGPDTATRLKTVWQVKTALVDANTTCASEPPPWAAASTGQLTARAQPGAPSDKPCIVPPGAGYRRLENQLYRVEIHKGGTLAGNDATFKWSRDNGSIAARVAAIAGGKITLTTSRKDSALGFAPGQWIEISDAAHELAGTPGPLAHITAVDDLVLTVDQNTVIGNLPGSLNQALFPKVRRWDSDPGAAPVSLPATNNGFIALEDGVEVKFDAGSYRTGDYWMIPARTDHGDIEWPQASPSNPLPQLPHGIRHHFCRLAIIEVAVGGVVKVVEDCRPIFPPLTEIEDGCGCCTKTVGETGAADYRSIQEAINSLPATGGHICVFAGNYVESVEIFDRRDITITGCGARSRIVGAGPAAGSASAAPVIHVRGGRNITIDSLAVEAHETGIGILAEGTDSNFDNQFFVNQAFFPLINVTLTQLLVIGTAHSAIRAQSVQQLTIRDCHVQMRDTVCLDHAIFALGDDILIERNVVEVAAQVEAMIDAPLQVTVPTFTVDPITGQAVPTGVTETFTLDQGSLRAGFQRGSNSRGGIQIGGTSDRVRIINNLIRGGSGNGITLGSLIFIDKGSSKPIPVPQWPKQPPVDPCDPVTPATAILVVVGIKWLGIDVRAASAGTLTEILIERNRIYEMGMNGIGIVGFFDLEGADEFITVEKLSIIGNDIRRCLRRTIAPISNRMIDSSGYGGISLADVEQLVIRDNLIADNGRDHLEPVCGIFVLHAEGMEISRNHIRNNGPKNSEPASEAKIGRRGGINIVYAIAPVTPIRAFGANLATRNCEPALKVEGNIVSAPLGQALSVTALGPISVVANEFASQGVIQSGLAATSGAATVAIFNLGLSNEFYWQLFAFWSVVIGSFSAEGVPVSQARPGLDDQRLGTYLANGNVLFANNQCVLDIWESGETRPTSSIGIFTLDDIAFNGNQCDCNLLDDYMVAQVFMFGISLRMNDNRLKESLLHAAYSAVTLGFVNMTTHNQTTHCLLAWALHSPSLFDTPNTALIELVQPGRCRNFDFVKDDLGHSGRG